MGSLTTGVGLISGIDTASIVDQLIALESRPKIRLQQRVARLQAQQSALMDINARLLNLRNISQSFRQDDVFQRAKAVSSNKDILTAKASNKAQPGMFNFTVKQLVSSSQMLSKGFGDLDTTPLGLTSMSFQFGKGRASRDFELNDLNGGQGVANGKIVINDRSGNQATIDLTDATHLNEVLSRINSNESVSVKASVDGDRLRIEDTSGGEGTLSISNAGGQTTATDLGIAGSSSDGLITGTVINYLNGDSSVSRLNDGTGVLVRDNVSDLRITTRAGVNHDIDLGRIDADIEASTPLSELNNGNGVTISDDFDNKDIKFVARDGTEYEVNLTGVTTVGGLISRVNNETGGHINLEITDGNRLSVIDTVGGSGTLQIHGAGENGTQTAEDLGILNEDGVSEDSFLGEIIPNTISQAPVATLQQVIDRIEEQTNGDVTASLSEDGKRLILTDQTGGTQNFVVRTTAGNPHAARHLGIDTGEDGVASDTITGHNLIAELNSVLVRNLNGGAGLNGATTLEISDRSGASVTLNDLDQYNSLSQIIEAINNAAEANSVSIHASLNSAGTGLKIVDESGSTANNLVIGGDAAAALGIEADVAKNNVNGDDLSHRYVSEASRLSDLNYGRGVQNGSFRITDGFGESATVNITDNHKTLYDVIQLINSRGIAVKARVNDTGDGLVIEESIENGQTPFTSLKVEAINGTTAQDLNIVGQAEGVGKPIDGSYRRTIEFNETDTLQQVVKKINESGAPVSASIVNAGSGANPFRLNFTSKIAGLEGDLIIDSGDFDFGLTTATKAKNAKVFFGDPDSSGGFLVTSKTNSVKNVLDGVTIDLHSASDEPVTVTVSPDTDGIINTVESFVKAFNDAIAKIDEYDFFDLDSEERGLLLGNPTTSRVRQSLLRTVRQPAEGIDTQFKFLSQVGIRIGSEGKLEFDQARFTEAYESSPEAVENLFAAFESSSPTPEEIAPGVTVQGSDDQVSMRGLGDIFNDLLKGLTDPFDGTFKRVEDSFRRQIDQTNDRIAVLDQRLEARRKQLERQFAAMEEALSKIQNQSGALASLANNVSMAASFGQRRGIGF